MRHKKRRTLDFCPGNAKGRRKLRRYKRRVKEAHYKELYSTGRSSTRAMKFARQYMRPCVVASPNIERGLKTHEALEGEIDYAGMELRVSSKFLQQAEEARRMQPEINDRLKKFMGMEGFAVVAEVEDSIVFSRTGDRPIRGHTVDKVVYDDANFMDGQFPEDVTVANNLEDIGRRHDMNEEDIATLRARFFKAYPHLKALAQQLKGEK